MYGEFASWFHLLTAPEDYAEEAAAYLQLLRETADGEVRALLELGSGGGNNAFHYKRAVRATLTDLSADMLALSATINPECEHIQGDMRTLRLGRTFDAVFVHDAIGYLTTEADLAACFATASAHLRPGGAALFVPDYVRETFKAVTDHGGHDAADGSRGMRYLEWVHEPDAEGTTYRVDYAYLLREGDIVRAAADRHEEGLFPRETWLRLLRESGFVDVLWRQMAWTDEPTSQVAFAARRPSR